MKIERFGADDIPAAGAPSGDSFDAGAVYQCALQRGRSNLYWKYPGDRGDGACGRRRQRTDCDADLRVCLSGRSGRLAAHEHPYGGGRMKKQKRFWQTASG